jgi:hypothetical protein
MGRKSSTASLSPKSGKELAKVSAKKKLGQEVSRTKFIFGKGTPKYWERKIYRPIWSDDAGQRREVTNYFVRVMVGGRRVAVALNSGDRFEAARRASLLYEKIRAIGWDAALRAFDPEWHTPKSDVTVADAVAAIGRADLRATTKANYVGALRWFAARHVGFETSKKTFGPKGAAEYRRRVGPVQLAALNQANVRLIVDRHIQSASGDAAAERSSRISAASFIRNAKAALRVGGRPPSRPRARAADKPALVRSLINWRSNSARLAKMLKTSLPLAVVVSRPPSFRDFKPTPRW